MVLAFTEEQKQRIESSGMLVIEFKQRIAQLGTTLKEVAECLIITFEEVITPVIKWWREVLDEAKFVYEEICNITDYPTSIRYRICKVLSKCTGVEKKKIWKMTCHTWLARSCC